MLGLTLIALAGLWFIVLRLFGSLISESLVVESLYRVHTDSLATGVRGSVCFDGYDTRVQVMHRSAVTGPVILRGVAFIPFRWVMRRSAVVGPVILWGVAIIPFRWVLRRSAVAGPVILWGVAIIPFRWVMRRSAVAGPVILWGVAIIPFRWVITMPAFVQLSSIIPFTALTHGTPSHTVGMWGILNALKSN